MTCEKCGATLEIGMWPFCPHPGEVSLVTEKTYPFTTKNFNGKEIEVTSRAHERALCQQYGVTKRDDVAWVEKEYQGYNWRTKKQEYREGRGVGLPGCFRDPGINQPGAAGNVGGVARRTTRRIVATSAIVATLPPNCTPVVLEGTTLQQCGGTYYQPSGNQYRVVNVE